MLETLANLEMTDNVTTVSSLNLYPGAPTHQFIKNYPYKFSLISSASCHTIVNPDAPHLVNPESPNLVYKMGGGGAGQTPPGVAIPRKTRV